LKKHNPGFGSLSLLLAGLVAVMALSLGCVFLFTTIWAEDFPNNRQLAGALFIAFGCYRGYMGWRRYRLQQQNEDDEN
jgi:drug/metabolite transporter (DMT)-like permease